MTVTVKLDAPLEEQLRRHAALAGLTASDVIRAALVAYLAQPAAPQQPSAYALGQALFGRHGGPVDLAERRKARLTKALAERHARRGAPVEG